MKYYKYINVVNNDKDKGLVFIFAVAIATIANNKRLQALINTGYTFTETNNSVDCFIVTALLFMHPV